MIEMLKNQISRLRDRRGFSLAEMLMVLLILLLVTAVVVVGIPAAVNAYQKTVDSANAQVLLSTTLTALRNELSTAADVELDEDDGSLVYYRNTNLNCYAALTCEATDPGIHVVYLTYKEGEPQLDDANNKSWLLVSGKAATQSLHTEFESITYEYDDDAHPEQGGCFVVTGLRVLRGTSVLAGAEDSEYYIRALNPVI